MGDHFKQIGNVAFANVGGKAGKGGGKGIGGINFFQLMAAMQGGGGKGFAGMMKGMGMKMVGEVRYDEPFHAMMACQVLNGSYFNGSPLEGEMDWSSQDNFKLTVSGVPAGTGWQDLKDHFAQIAPVAFVNVTPAGA